LEGRSGMQISFRTAWLAGCFTAMLVVPGKPVPVADGVKVATVAQADVQRPDAVGQPIGR
jgi:hypothetical protein